MNMTVYTECGGNQRKQARPIVRRGVITPSHILLSLIKIIRTLNDTSDFWKALEACQELHFCEQMV